jgi:hypothetical protein
MPQNPHWDAVGPPPLALFAQEQIRALGAFANFGARRRLLREAPRGDGHPVLVMPGFLAFESSEVVSEGKGYRIRGELTLHGVTRPISAKVNRPLERPGLHQPARLRHRALQSDAGHLEGEAQGTRPPLGARRRASAARFLTATSHALVDGLSPDLAANARARLAGDPGRP